MWATSLLRTLALLLALALAGALEEAPHPATGAKASQDAEVDFLSVKLVTHPLCVQDIHRLCAGDNSIALNDNTPNLDIMSCLLDQQEEEEDAGVSPQCHHVSMR
ncbi:uncharacterized protein LOC119114916 [Pollicipes pollicipes]|uniref:uncharacterized protein LOC119114913 n=1 Tax=Pollicipes pollicipes TaxID=41117 RepID=UPI0018851651|nr:uncharacterized protein LOC119114913 [Pollicipes pollicipes]XP_037094870.1 uncharacterized protein LOC119114916 [Pollicipes pollicipes]